MRFAALLYAKPNVLPIGALGREANTMGWAKEKCKMQNVKRKRRRIVFFIKWVLLGAFQIVAIKKMFVIARRRHDDEAIFHYFMGSLRVQGDCFVVPTRNDEARIWNAP